MQPAMIKSPLHTLVATVVIVGCLAPDLAGQRRRQRLEAPDLEHLTYDEERFDSAALGRSVQYTVLLPADYDDKANHEKRYPLVIWLHGMFEDHERFYYRGAATLDRLAGEGVFPEAIFVCPNGDRMSFYINAKTKDQAYEDMIRKDLVAHVEATYRVKPGRENRALCGVSMGGYGALKIALPPSREVRRRRCAFGSRRPAPRRRLGSFERVHRGCGGGAGRLKALGSIYGNPIDREKRYQDNNLLVLADEDGQARSSSPSRSTSTAGDRGPATDSARRTPSSAPRSSRRSGRSSTSGRSVEGWRPLLGIDSGFTLGTSCRFLAGSTYVAKQWSKKKALNGLERHARRRPEEGPREGRRQEEGRLSRAA